MTHQLSKDQAEQALAAIKQQFGYQVDAGYPGPVLQEPGFQCDGYAIAWEEGPYQWTYHAFHGGHDEEVYTLAVDAGMTAERAKQVATIAGVPHPEGVHAEAVNHWCLGLYPA